MKFNGPPGAVARTLALINRSAVDVSLRRRLHGPRLPSWNWTVEFTTEMLRRQLQAAFLLPSVEETRRYLGCVVVNHPVLEQMSINSVAAAGVSGKWFTPLGTVSASGETGPKRLPAMLYFHGGGYSFAPESHANLIASITLAAQSRTFAADYRLSPEHRFPAQLEDALAAYRWLLEQEGVDPRELVVAGDSAGGNLALALLISVRDRQLPPPALAIALSPPTDFEQPAELLPGSSSLLDNEPYDWISPQMLLRWADWFCRPDQRRDPLVSPVYADLRGLPPMYIQAGEAEIMYDSIRAFVARAQAQGVDVVLETWKDMNHDFQIFGPLVPQSAQALRRIGEVVAARVPAREQQTAV